MSNYLLIGAVGIIGYKVAEMLLGDGDFVYGVDDLNTDYDVRSKHYRLGLLKRYADIQFSKFDIGDRANMDAVSDFSPDNVSGCINLAARVGVRTSRLIPEPTWTPK